MSAQAGTRHSQITPQTLRNMAAGVMNFYTRVKVLAIFIESYVGFQPLPNFTQLAQLETFLSIFTTQATSSITP